MVHPIEENYISPLASTTKSDNIDDIRGEYSHWTWTPSEHEYRTILCDTQFIASHGAAGYFCFGFSMGCVAWKWRRSNVPIASSALQTSGCQKYTHPKSDKNNRFIILSTVLWKLIGWDTSTCERVWYGMCAGMSLPTRIYSSLIKFLFFERVSLKCFRFYGSSIRGKLKNFDTKLKEFYLCCCLLLLPYTIQCHVHRIHTLAEQMCENALEIGKTTKLRQITTIQ